MQNFPTWIIAVYSVICVVYGITQDVPESEFRKSYVKNAFAPEDKLVVNHLVVSEDHGYVYVATINRLYQLHKDLTDLVAVKTGPELDHVLCQPYPRPCLGKERHLSNNTNKLLLVDKQNDRLIVCGSIYQGTCKTRSLVNISQVFYQIPNNTLDLKQADFVACPLENSSTVGVITQGPTVNNNVLYVATATPNANIYSPYSSISTHSLHRDSKTENKLFRLAIEVKDSEGSAYKIEHTHNKFHYVYAFETGDENGFVYFLFNLTTVGEDTSLRPTIARICKSDPLYYSYIELPLACGQSYTKYSLLTATYVPDQPPGHSSSDGTLYLAFETDTGSALCSMRKSLLDDLFYDTMDSCYKHLGYNGSRQIAHLVNGETCTNTKGGANKVYLPGGKELTDLVVRTPRLALDYYPGYKVPKKQVLCGAHYLPPKIARVEVTHADLVYEQPNVTFSGITTNTDGKKLKVAFIGTTEGYIIQVDLNNGKAYSMIDVGQPILPDFVWEENPNQEVPHLYVAAKHEVFRMQVAACSKYTTCESCTQSMDPYCGWCILESRCSTLKQCKTADYDRTRWLEPNATQCISASPPLPRERAVPGEISTRVYMLPVVVDSDHYQCLFDGSYPVDAKTKRNGTYTTVTCQAPTEEQLPSSFAGQDYVNISLSLTYNGQVEIVSTTAMFYDCHIYGKNLRKNSPCTGCLASRWPCRWCIDTHECVAREEKSVQCITDEKFCPVIASVKESDRLISVGDPRTITLNGSNLPSQGTYHCKVSIENYDNAPVITVPATRRGEQVICQEHKYDYPEMVSEEIATITVFWKLNFVVDNVQSDSIRLYKCSVSHNHCSLCVTSDPRYKCGWCGDQCTIRSSCAGPSTWITNATSCPEHSVESFSPTSGPLKGGTTLVISGTDMGTKAKDIQEVLVAGERCDIVRSEYSVSVRVVCITNPASTVKSGHVSVKIRNVTRHSQAEFKYRDPVLTGMLPQKGPQAGGTSVSFIGKDIETGSAISVMIGNYTCRVKTELKTSGNFECVTSPALQPVSLQKVEVRFDRLRLNLPQTFTYTQNPKVEEYSTLSPKLASFLGGGRNITFRGKHFTSVQYPMITAGLKPGTYVGSGRRRRSFDFRRFVSRLRRHRRKRRSFSRPLRSAKERALPAYHTAHYATSCTVINATFMYCPTPMISRTQGANASSNVSQTFVYQSSLLLVMDNVKIKLVQSGNAYPLTYYPNPHVRNLDNSGKQYRENTSLTFKVFNLDKRAITKEEIVVMVASERCNVTALDGEVMHCTVPAKKAQLSSYPVTVQIGNLRFTPGSIQYYSDQVVDQTIIIIICVVGGALLLVAAFAIFYCVRKSKSYKANKNDFQKAMENMEISVRADFRKAFAELSIDMTDLAGDLGDYGKKSYLDYRTYATNLFFPSLRYHSCMAEPAQSTAMEHDLEQGLSQFFLLLSQHNFLSVLIHTLEEQKTFSNRDKGNVASLLTVVLHQKLDYFTEIMKSLVSDLIGVNVQRNPKLILRRSDSVAERMLSNWMYICLYPHLRDNAGSSIFLLLKAIKQQVSKGPLDGITGKVRYTLNDDRLLKEDIEFETLTLFVAPSNEMDDEPVIVKVLSCDSVTQVKEKVMDAVYKRVPFSQRPRPEQLDIEWRHGRGGHLVLPTQDYTMEPGSRWRRLMCIADYKVPNNATLALMPTQQEQHGSQELSSAVSNHSVDTSPLSPMLPEESATKTYHLAKYSDDIDAKRESAINRDRHKHIPELYLLRLINMKGILQNYVEGVMQAILDKNSIPIPVRHFFHFLDEIAAKHDITDHEILHMWKTNSFMLRFWVTILKNPESVFDVEKPDTIASSMDVISQTFIDACSVQEHKPTKDSPINKQLYAKEIPTYKKMVQDYYKEIKEQPPVSDQDVSAYIAEISREHACGFDRNAALYELWCYVSKFFEEINETLENDPNISPGVRQRLQQTYTLIDQAISSNA